MAIQEIPDLRGFSHLTDLLYLYCHHYHLSVIEVPDNSQSGTNLGKVVPPHIDAPDTYHSGRLFLPTHLPFVLLPASVKADSSACKVVYLCRNPKDTFVSLWHFTNKLKHTSQGTNSLEEAFDMFCRGVSLYGPYWDNVLGYWKKSLENPQKILFLKYEEMKEQPAANLRRLGEFLGCPLSPEENVRPRC
jgi:hypothetical protein